MAAYNLVEDYFHRRAWNETWDYPVNAPLIALNKDIPILAPFYFSWETNFSPLPLITFSRNNYWLAPFCAILYLICVYFGVKWMENKRPYDLRGPLKYWNLFLSIFSAWASIRLCPHLIFYIRKVGFLNTLCSPSVWSQGDGAVSLWLTAFAFSKIVEFIDTVFLVLRKKPLKFLHWFHHSSAVLFFWDAYVTEQPAALYFAAMNYPIHAIMYFYYYLAACGKPQNWGIFITFIQIVQMIIAVTIGVILVYFTSRYNFLSYSTAETAFKPFDVPGCYAPRANVWWGLALYSFFLYLFTDFFLERYMPKALGGSPTKAPQRKRE